MKKGGKAFRQLLQHLSQAWRFSQEDQLCAKNVQKMANAGEKKRQTWDTFDKITYVST
jgi:hypothetical protein